MTRNLDVDDDLLAEAGVEHIPPTLAARDRWMVWRNEEGRKIPKAPWDRPLNFGADTQDPSLWVDVSTALEYAAREDVGGLAYVIANSDPDHDNAAELPDPDHVLIDFDYVRDPETRDHHPIMDRVLEDAGSYAQVSTSGTGYHVVGRARLPDGVDTVDEDLLKVQGFEDANVEIYDNARYIAFTGDQVDETPADTNDVQALVDEIAAAADQDTGDSGGREERSPKKSRDELADVETTSDFDDIVDAIDHVRPRDIRLQSTVTKERADGTKDLDPSWASSESGTRLAQVGDGWIYRKGMIGLDALQVVALEEGIIRDERTYPEGEAFYDAVDALRERGAHIPEYENPAEQPVSAVDSDASPAEWSTVRAVYEHVKTDPAATKGQARRAAADKLEEETDWMYVLESERLWAYDEDSGTYGRFGAAEAGSVLVEKLGEHYSQTEKREIIGQIEDRNQVHREVLNARQRDDPLLCVGNGVVNLRTGDLMDHSPAFRFVRGLPWDYDPDDADPDRILSFLDDVTERVADRDTLLDHLAHGLMPGHPYRAFVVCYGPGGNGKTQVAELFRGFVGDENAAAVEIDELTNDDFATGDLPGKFLNWGDDMAGDGGGTLDELSLLKKATGGSKIRANEKFEKTFDFKNEAALFFSANEPPRIGERKRSIQDRLYPIEMPYRFVADPDPDDPLEKTKTPNIAETLLSDDDAMRGLLALAVEHAQDLIDTRGEYSQPETPEERLQKYNQSADPIVKFAGKALEAADPDFKIRKDDAHRVYRQAVESWGERPASERGFKRQFPGAFPDEIETARSRKLSTPDDENDRVRCWKRMKWTDTARKHMPEWLEQRYADHFDDDTPAAPDKPSPTDPAAGFDDLDPGRHTVEATVAATFDPKPWLQAEGELVDEDGTLVDYVARGQRNPMNGVEEGDTVRIENATVETDDDGLLRVRVTTACDVATVSQTEPEQSALDDDDDGGGGDGAAGETDARTGDAAAADGGTERVEDREGARADLDLLAQTLRELGATNPDQAATVPMLWATAPATEIADADRVAALLKKGTREGRFGDTSEGDYYLLDG